jgi:hypothetical protein
MRRFGVIALFGPACPVRIARPAVTGRRTNQPYNEIALRIAAVGFSVWRPGRGDS